MFLNKNKALNKMESQLEWHNKKEASDGDLFGTVTGIR